MIYLTTLLFTFTFILALFRRQKRFAAERKRQIVQTWPRAVALFTGPIDKRRVPPSRKGYPVKIKVEPPKTGYSYSVRGKQYAGFHLSPKEELINAESDERVLESLSNNDAWRIYYNPADPTEAYLSPGPPHVHTIHFLLDFFFLIFIPAVMLFSIYGLLTHTR